MKLIDANIVIYAMGEPHAYKLSCQRVFSLVYEGRLEANIDTELLQEILHFYQRRNHLDFGLALFDRLVTLFPDPFPVSRERVVLARDMLARHRQVEARDALHAAVVLQEDLEGIISADRGFDSIAGLTRFDPMQL